MLNESECQSLTERLYQILERTDLGWVASEARSFIAQGKQVKREVTYDTQSLGLFEEEEVLCVKPR